MSCVVACPPVFYCTLSSPIGPLLLAGNDQGLQFLLFQNGRQTVAPDPAWQQDRGSLKEPVRQLTAYFAGQAPALRRDGRAPGDAVSAIGLGDELQRIPYGETISYRRAGDAHRQSARGSRRRSGQRLESHLHHHSVSSRHWQQRRACRLRRRSCRSSRRCSRSSAARHALLKCNGTIHPRATSLTASAVAIGSASFAGIDRVFARRAARRCSGTAWPAAIR